MMFFTRLATVAAWIALVAGMFDFGLGWVVDLNRTNPNFDAARYLGSRTSGEAIDQGVLAITIGIVLGVLVEIHRSIRRKASA